MRASEGCCAGPVEFSQLTKCLYYYVETQHRFPLARSQSKHVLQGVAAIGTGCDVSFGGKGFGCLAVGP